MREHAKAIICAAQPALESVLCTVIDVKAQNTRMLEWLKDISRTSGDKGAVMGARQLLKEFAE